MPELEKKQNFWTTMPGILTGVAALLTALTGLLVVVHPHSGDASKGTPASSSGLVAGSSTEHLSTTPTSTNSSAAAAPTAAPAPTAKVTKGFVTLTSKTGEVTQLSVSTFRHNYYDKAIELTSGQTILFEKIRVIDFVDQNREQQESTVKVTLIDGRVIPGTLKTYSAYKFQGGSDIGPFNIQLYDVKQVAFPPAN